jgi:LysR family transcriptional activator of nhaA
VNNKQNYWLNYHHLYYFMVIAEEGSVSKAAEKLRLGQPTLSLQLKTLEETLGAKLFERDHKKLTLTEAGQISLKYAHDIFVKGNELLEVLHDYKAPLKTHVQIGALDSVPKHLIVDVVTEALKRGECSVSILEGKAEELTQELLLHKIDLFISDRLTFDQAALKTYSREICKVPVHVYGHKKYLTLKNNFPKSLDQAPFIMPTVHSQLRYQLEQFFLKNHLNINCISETQDTALQKLLGIEGLGLVALPTFALKNFNEKNELHFIGKLPGIYQQFYFVAADRKIANPISSSLMKEFSL